MRKLPLTILIGLFLGLLLIRTLKSYSPEPQLQLVKLLSEQGYQEVKISESNFSFCPKILEIPVRFQATLQDKTIEGIACFPALGNGSPRIQFKNQ